MSRPKRATKTSTLSALRSVNDALRTAVSIVSRREKRIAGFEPLVEWVAWEGKHGERSRYHVRLSTQGALLCGRSSPPTAPATVTPPSDRLCRVCVSKLPELARRSGLK